MLKKDHPELAKYWNYERNSKSGLYFKDVSAHSGKKAWWICDRGHEWEATIDHVSNGTRCPYCANKKAFPGYNDLATINPRLVKEWNYEKNGGLTLKDFLPNSNKKAWWKCERGHEYEALICDRNSGNGCPICAGKVVLPGFNDLVTINPKLADEWNYEKNGDLKPTDFTPNSDKKVWWKCKYNHEWQASIANRNKNHGCPFCSGRNAIPGQNDLSTLNPKLASEWNYEKNGDLKPQDCTLNSSRIVWWKCPKSHEWRALISNRNKGRNCPFCGNKKILPGYNDLETTNPKLASEWNYNKNGKLKPSDVFAKSGMKVWWECKKGHEWQATIASRGGGRECPICSQNLRVSFPEKTIFFYIRRVFPDAIENYKPSWLNRKELDIYIPSKKIGIEYDGVFYHENEKRDMEKDQLCSKQGVTVVHIREKSLSCKALKSIVFTLPKEINGNIEDLIPGLKFLEKQLKVDLNIYIPRDYDEIRSMVVSFDLENCIAKTHPELLDEWDYEKNGEVGNTPENVSFGANIFIWWKCKKGHSYRTKLNNKTSSNTGCPYCANKKVLKGFNDLATIKPEIAKEWDYEKNGDLKPEDILSGSHKKVWWRCSECGNEWGTSPELRKNTRCKKCNRKGINPNLIKGVNDLATLKPEIVKMWDHTENGDLTPKDVTTGSGKKVWWRCNKGHKWQASICNVAGKGSRCPYCSGRRKLKNE